MVDVQEHRRPRAVWQCLLWLAGYGAVSQCERLSEEERGREREREREREEERYREREREIERERDIEKQIDNSFPSADVISHCKRV